MLQYAHWLASATKSVRECALNAHCTLAGLLCLKTAKSGGESSWSSSVSVHNELLRLGRADLVETLAGDWWVDRKVCAAGVLSSPEASSLSLSAALKRQLVVN